MDVYMDKYEINYMSIMCYRDEKNIWFETKYSNFR